MNSKKISYAEGILSGFRYLLSRYSNVFVIGQGLWSPWYVGASMADLDKEFGKERIIDSPVSEASTTGVGVGASICGYRPIVVHPRMDFMILAVDQIVNQAAKWSHMLGGRSCAPVTFRGIINRGGEQGAQHSQALHAWFSHIPGLRVVMPATPSDARDLLIASVLSDDPVLYIDDRWLYEVEQEVETVREIELATQKPQVLKVGEDLTLVGCGYATHLCLQAAESLTENGISCEVIDLRILNPLDLERVAISVRKTGRLLVVDEGWKNCGVAGEVMAGVMEKMDLHKLKEIPQRLTLPDAPAPTSKVLEDIYYIRLEKVVERVVDLVR